MVSAVKKDTGNMIYMRLLKHECPLCNNRLKVVKMTRVVKSKSREAKKFNFNACDIELGDKVKFIWYEFKCKECDVRFTEAQLREHEKKERRQRRKDTRIAARAARSEKRAEKAEKADNAK